MGPVTIVLYLSALYSLGTLKNSCKNQELRNRQMVLFPEYTRYTSTDNQDPRPGHGLRVLLTCPLTPSERMSQIMGRWLGLKAFNEQNDFIAPPPPTVPKPSKPLGPFGHMVAFVTKLQQARIRSRGRGATDRHTQRGGGRAGRGMPVVVCCR